MRGLAKFIMRGRKEAIFIAAFFGSMSILLLPLAIFSAAAIGLVQLRKGWSEVAYIGLVAGVLIVAASLFLPARAGFPFPLVFALWVVVFVGTAVLRASQSQVIALIAVGGFCALFVIAMHLIVGDVVTWWSDWFKVVITNVDGATFDSFEEEGVLRIFNGFVAMVAGLAGMMTVLLARWMQSFLYNPEGYKTEFVSLMLPKMMLPVVVAILFVAGMIKDELMADLFIVGVVVYFFQGLATLHGLGTKKRWNKSWFAVPYLALMFVPQILIPGFAAFGALDTTMDFRAIRRGRKV